MQKYWQEGIYFSCFLIENAKNLYSVFINAGFASFFFFLALWPEKVLEYWKIISSSVYIVCLARQREAVPNMRSSGPQKQALASRKRSLHCQGKYTCI